MRATNKRRVIWPRSKAGIKQRHWRVRFCQGTRSLPRKTPNAWPVLCSDRMSTRASGNHRSVRRAMIEHFGICIRPAHCGFSSARSAMLCASMTATSSSAITKPTDTHSQTPRGSRLSVRDHEGDGCTLSSQRISSGTRFMPMAARSTL